ncbi:MAG: DUF4115 domain-containing protein [Actinomycetota bacterium]|nr:DUF4115 domain-containing protein [Actinomycetota bacterium]
MIALILLILVVVVVGGGIEVLRRMRFGGGSAAAHHRALDTLGNLTTQGADRRVDLAPVGAPMLEHVRRVVEADPTHPRIRPQPISRPVGIPSSLIGSDAAAATSVDLRHRPAPPEIEGVRVLLPDPPPDNAGDDSIDHGDSVDDVTVGDDAAALAGDDTGSDEDGDNATRVDDDKDPRVQGGDTPITKEIDAGTGGGESAPTPDAIGAPPVGPEAAQPHILPALHDVAGQPIDEAVAEEAVADEAVADEAVADEAVADADATPGAIDDSVHQQGSFVVGEANGPTEVLGGEDLSGAIAGTPVSPPTSSIGIESVRVVRADDPGDLRSPGIEGRASPDEDDVSWADERGTTTVAAVSGPYLPESGDAASARVGDLDTFRVLPSFPEVPAGTEDAALKGPGRSPSAHTVFASDPEPKDHPLPRPGRSSAAGGAFQPAEPEDTRAQLAALARSGRVEAVGGGARRHRERSRRSRGHGRASRRPGQHRGLRMATATLAVIVAGVAIASAVVIVNRSSTSHGQASRTIPVAAAPTTTAPPQPASLVAKTTSTATYQLVGTPTISFVGSGRCWIEVRQGDQTGKILFEGVLAPGAQKSMTGPFWVRLGNPAAISVHINGTVLDQPANPSGNPYNLQFQ